VHLLDDQEGDPALLAGMLQGFPTAALAVFELPGSWAELREGGARLTHFHVGQG
jgi:phosphohistidine phosphatase